MSEPSIGYTPTPFYEVSTKVRRYDFLLIAAVCFGGICLTVLQAAHLTW